MNHGIITGIITALLISISIATNAATERSQAQISRATLQGGTPAMEHDADALEFDGKRIVKTENEWKKLLTPAQFYILRQKGTEEPYTGQLTDNHEHGIYYCAACGLALFRSETKFDSGTGWPSFYQAIFPKNLTEETDTSLDEVRTEVLCSRCRSHIGHVFDDGPKPTGLRYCMNSAALKFEKTK